MKRKGFTLIELLIVVAIIGIIVAIAIPNLLSAVQRSRQKRTMADMRAIANVWETYYVDYSYYYNAGHCNTYDAAGGTFTSTLAYANLAAYLTPTYIAVLPMNDGWNNAFYFYIAGTPSQAYGITSLGKNLSADAYCGMTKFFDNDITFAVGHFTEWPEGAQKSGS